MSDGWATAPLSEVTVLIKRGRAPKYAEDGALVVSQKCIQSSNSFSTALARRTDVESKPVPDWAWLQETDTLVNSTGRGTLGRAAYVGHLSEKATADSHVAIVRPNPTEVVPLFLALVLSARTSEIESLQSGSTSQTELSPSALGTLHVPLPPLSVQRRIIDLMTHLDAHIANLRAEREALLGDLRRARDLVMRSGESRRAGDVFDILMGRQRSPSRATGPSMTPYLRAANVKDGRLDLSDVKEMDFDTAERARFGLKWGDVLVSEGSGSADAVGASARWGDELASPICLQNTLLRYRAVEGESTPSFVYHWCRWAYETGAFRETATGTNILHIGSNRAVEMRVGWVDPEQQVHACALLDEYEAVIASLDDEAGSLAEMRATLLRGLLDGTIALPSDYDALLSGAA